MPRSLLVGTVLRIAVIVAALLGPGALAGTAAAETYALVVGANRYAHSENLLGAVNDARDLSSVMERSGAQEVVRLLDDEVTRAAVTEGWQRLLSQAKPGDLLVFTYAGHGSQIPETVPGNEPTDGLDEVFVLPGFLPGQKTPELIIDDELNAWFQQAADAGVRVLFIADSCYSGTVSRAIDPRAPRLPSRNDWITEDDLRGADFSTVPYRPDGADRPATLTFISADQEHKRVQERYIDGKPRGVLSYVAARALEGAAEENGDGILDHAELTEYVREKVRVLSEARQTPNVETRQPGSSPVIAITGEPALPKDGSLRLFIDGPASSRAALEHLHGVVVVPWRDQADLVWDVRAGDVISSHGDPIAVNLRRTEIEGVLEKWQALEQLKGLAVGTEPLAVRICPPGTPPDDAAVKACSAERQLRMGERITIAAAGITQPYFTLFSLANDGTVFFLYPSQPMDWPEVPTGRPFMIEEIEAVPPPGAEHIVAIASRGQLDGLHTVLGTLQESKAAKRVADAVEEALDGEHAQLGILGIYLGE